VVDVAGLEPAAPCLQSRPGKTLTALSGVAYMVNQRHFRSLKCPEVVPRVKLYAGWKIPILVPDNLRRWIGERAPEDVTVAKSRGAVLLWCWLGHRAT
jgi:hypothetical protein